MKLCTGCKYLHTHHEQSRCLQPYAVEPVSGISYNPFTGKNEYVRNPNAPFIAPLTLEMRKQGSACGPDATLFEPGWLLRMSSWVRGKLNGEA